MNLQEELQNLKQELLKITPESVVAIQEEVISYLRGNSYMENAPQIGEQVENFKLPNLPKDQLIGKQFPNFKVYNQWGEYITLEQLVNAGAIVINFYKGNWCPYCNVELKALQNIEEEINNYGASIVAISLESFEQLEKTIEMNDVKFLMLSDQDAEVAKLFNILYESDAYAGVFRDHGMDIPKHNNSDLAQFMIPATFIVGKDRTVEYAFCEADFTVRANLQDILTNLKRLQEAQ